MARLPFMLFTLVFLLGTFTVYHFISARKKGKPWSKAARQLFLEGRWEIDKERVSSTDPDHAQRFDSFIRALVIGGIVFLAVLAWWLHDRY
jgi:hypothetical protein